MYQRYFGFNEKPFDVTPDPRFLYLSEHHQEALASIIYGIRERRGFITLVGEVGTGKTTLLNATLESLDDSTQTAFIFNTDVNFEELLQMVLMEFDLSNSDEMVQKYVALDRLNRFATEQFSRGGNVALLIDEAQNLDTRTMENLRLLSNLETRRHKLIQIVLSGQPELDEKLRRNELRQLAQRINMRRYIMPLNESDTYQYILQHIDKAGFKGKHLFDRSSLKQIWDFSGGVPRKINLLCDNALLIAYGLGKKNITKAIIDEAIVDLSWNPYETVTLEQPNRAPEKPVHEKHCWYKQRHYTIAAVLLLSLLLGIGSFGFLHMQTGIRELPAKAKRYVTGILGFNHNAPAGASDSGQQGDSVPADRSGILSMPGPETASRRPQSDITEPAPETGNAQETADDPGMPIEEIKAPAQVPQETASGWPPPRIEEDEGPAQVSELDVKKPKPTVISSDKPRIVEEDILTLPRTRRSGASENRSSIRIAKNSRGDNAARAVVVRKNDYLARIIRNNYGENSVKAMQLVLRANPQIRNPDLIVPGQVIRLPAIESDGVSNKKTKARETQQQVSKKKNFRRPEFYDFPRR